MAGHLLVVEGPDKDRHFPLADNGIIVIGTSHRHAEICLHDMRAARSHCELELDGDQVIVVDLDSEGGTFVNGNRVTRHSLRPGDLVGVGDTKLCLRSGNYSKPKKVEERDEGSYVIDEPPPEPIAALAGTALAHYQLEALLARGHSGAVYRARDQKTRGIVALKVLSADFPKTDLEKQNYIGAMKTMLPLRHAHLISLLGTGKAGAHYWMALEYVDGSSLASVLRTNGPAGVSNWKEALRLAFQAARALEYAHRHQLWHGNLTPANVLIQKDDRATKINDLVLERALEGSALKQGIFQTKFAAEISYMSPEQTHGPHHGDARSDLYGLGALVYAMLAGRPPFQASTPVDIIKRIRKVPPTPPRKIKPAIPEAFEEVLLRLLAKDPEERYESATELAADLASIVKQTASA